MNTSMKQCLYTLVADLPHLYLSECSLCWSSGFLPNLSILVFNYFSILFKFSLTPYIVCPVES